MDKSSEKYKVEKIIESIPTGRAITLEYKYDLTYMEALAKKCYAKSIYLTVKINHKKEKPSHDDIARLIKSCGDYINIELIG